MCGARMTKRFQAPSHKKESCCFHEQTDLSNSSISLNRHPSKCPPGKPLSKKKKMIPFLVSENGNVLKGISVTSYIPNHEVHQTTLDIPDATTLSIPMKYVDGEANDNKHR